jgi:rod shape-determining protein MreC
MAPYKNSLKFNNQAKVATASFLLFCLSLFVTAYSAHNPEGSKVGFMLIAEAQRPFQVAVDRFLFSITSSWEEYLNLLNVKQENKALNERLSALESMNSSLLEFKSENERLRTMLKTVENRKFNVLAANVIGYDAMSYSGAIILDRGTNHGIAAEMPVVQADNIVGQIVAVSLNSSKALLITDPSSAVDGIVQNSRVRGTIRGMKRYNLCDLQYVLPEDEVKIGDRIITSGMDRIFPKGLLVGIVSTLDKDAGSMFQKIHIKPSVDFSKLENVLIITDKKNE